MKEKEPSIVSETRKAKQRCSHTFFMLVVAVVFFASLFYCRWDAALALKFFPQKDQAEMAVKEVPPPGGKVVATHDF